MCTIETVSIIKISIIKKNNTELCESTYFKAEREQLFCLWALEEKCSQILSAKEEGMKRRERKLVVRRIFAGAMAGLMVLSAVDVSGWGVLTAKAEETTEITVAENPPQTLSITGADGATIISDGKLQDDGVSGNADTIYQGTNWYYDITKNQLVLDSASISGNILSINGDLSIMLSGTNTMRSDMLIQSVVTEGEIEHTLEINGNNYNGSLSCGTIDTENYSSKNHNMNIIGATLETSQIECSGSLTIENSHVVANNEDHSEVIESDKINIVDSYVEAKATTERGGGEVIKSNQKINISGSQIVVSRALASEEPVLSDCGFSNSVITKQWKDYDTNEDITKTSVYGTAALKENLMIASGQSIDFVSGASITNLDKLTVEDGAIILVDGAEHQHNTNGDVTYTWKDDNAHIKGVACKDCPIGYVTEETEAHSIGENGFCACNEVYQPAELTTDKYDMDGDDSKDEVYEISNAGQLFWFAGLVNGTLDGVEQNTSANAILMKDITVNENLLDSLQYDTEGNVSNGSDFISWTPIADCTEDHITQYSGTFDGNNKTVSGLYFNDNSTRIGLFGSSNADGNIKNVGVVDSCFKGNDFVGGVCGRNDGTITNCYNTGNLTAIEPSATIGGICGYNGGTITNCYNTGTVTATGSVASVGGVCGCSIAPISNCYNIGTVTATGSSADIGGICGYNFGPITNCYYLADTEDENGGKTTAQFASGEIAYLLSQGCTIDEVTYDGTIWGQTIGTDTYPTLGGAKVYQNAIYNGCEGKPGEAVSYEYSNTEKNTYGEHPDADNDGRCDACGAMIDGIGAKLVGYSLSLNGNIGVNFYMELTDKIIADKDAYMQFTLPNGTVTKVFVSEAQTNTTIKEGTTYYRFPCEVASYEMTQDIKAQMFDGSGNCGKEYTYTVRDYAQYIVTHSSYQDVVPFAVAMLNYGACSQKYFNKVVDDLANKYLTDDDQEIPDWFDGYIDGFTAKKAENDVLGQFAGLSMVLKSQTTLNIFYEPKEGIDVSKLTFSVDGKEITPVKRGQYYILSLENIRANELGNSKTFTVTDGKNTLSGDYCALMYCYQVLQAAEGTYEDDLVTLVKAFSVYAYTARSVCQSN